MTDELIELQTRIVFQEQALEEMNSVVTRQQDQLDHLQRELVLLREQYEELEQQAPAESPDQNERPPHY